MQKQPSRQTITKASFKNDMRAWRDEWKDKLLSVVGKWEKFKTIVENNYQLGREHLRRGNTEDAVLRFRFVIWLDANYRDSWHWLGCSYMAAGNTAAAKSALMKAIKQDPNNIETRYMLALVMGKAMPRGELPRAIPPRIVQEQFESLADEFNAQQLKDLGYEGHTLLANAIRAALVPGRVNHVALDLGAGTGLCGPLVRDFCLHLTGVDFSPSMLIHAAKLTDDRGNKIYDAIINRDVTAFLADGPDAGYDIIFAAGLVGYLGELQGFFEQCARLLKQGGIFAITADAVEGNSLQFDPEIGRFRFSQPYLGDLATRFGLTELRSREAAIYPESAGLLCVFRKD